MCTLTFALIVQEKLKRILYQIQFKAMARRSSSGRGDEPFAEGGEGGRERGMGGREGGREGTR